MLSRSRIVLVERYCQNQIFEGVHFEMQIGGRKRCPFKWKHWFLVSERSELSKNVYIYNSPKNMNERFFLDIATLTKFALCSFAKEIYTGCCFCMCFPIFQHSMLDMVKQRTIQ